MIIALASVTILLTSAKYSNANDIYIDQAGDNLVLTIDQKGENNQIKGTTTTDASIIGDGNNIDLQQGYEGNNLIELNVNGNNNAIEVGQEKWQSNGVWGDDTDSYGYHYALVDVAGNDNSVSIIQRNNIGGTDGHSSSVQIINGDNNKITTLQTGTPAQQSLVTIRDGRDNNIVDIFQNSGTSSHNSVMSVYSNGNNIDVNQTGNSPNNAYVIFSHHAVGPTDFTLNQSGGDTYGNPNTGSYATINCGLSAGCTVTVNQ